jgi:hypothetical protein
MTCLLRRCLKCGGAGQPCCAGGSCTSGCCVSQWDSLVENGPTCAAVGSACEPASSTSPICSANGSCTTTGTSCGGLGQACCLSTRYPTSTSYSYCSAQGTRCLYSATTRNDVCTPCGDKGQPCCLNGTTEQRCKTPYDCSSDTCQPRASTSTATATSTSITQ